MISSMFMSRLKGSARLISQGHLALFPSSTVYSNLTDSNVLVNTSAINAPISNLMSTREFSLSSPAAMPFEKRTGPRRWPRFNLKVYPPQSLEEKRRPAYVCHVKENIRCAPWKMWYVSVLIRGMSIDEALRQLDYVNKKAAHYIKLTLLEAQELAVQNHNVEFRSNLWVSESFARKGVVIKGVRRHARKRVGLVEYFHSHYFVTLEEGPPPLNYFAPKPDGPELLKRWLDDRRAQNIFRSM